MQLVPEELHRGGGRLETGGRPKGGWHLTGRINGTGLRWRSERSVVIICATFVVLLSRSERRLSTLPIEIFPFLQSGFGWIIADVLPQVVILFQASYQMVERFLLPEFSFSPKCDIDLSPFLGFSTSEGRGGCQIIGKI